MASTEKPKYPPFPAVPPNVAIIPFSDFKESGIRIFGLPFGEDLSNDEDEGVEVDGLGIPTVPLRVPHNTDECKTNTRRKGQTESDIRRKEKDAREKGKGDRKKKEAEEKEKTKDKDLLKNMNPIERAQELKRRRILLFAKKEWYDQWKEGEDLRGTKVYDPNSSIIDRIHLASTEFRTGRTWPPSTTRVGYLWDQFRLFAGLLGSPPIWYRTDLQQEPEDVLDDTADYDDDPTSVSPYQSKPSERAMGHKATVISDDEFEGDDESEIRDSTDTNKQKDPQLTNADPPEQKRKRIPARTPYALHNFEPVPVSSDAQLKALIRLASLRKHTKLLAFLSDPEQSVKVFLSWYTRKEGLVWSPAHLNALPRLLVFFLELLIRTKAMPESERSLRRAVEVAKQAVDEIPKTGRLCRNLPDNLGVGCRAIWDVQWAEEPFKFTRDIFAEDPEKEEAAKKFEEDLKANNVQVLSADNIIPPPLKFDTDDEKEGAEESVIATPAASQPEISIQVMSPTSPGFVEPDSPSYFEKVAPSTSVKEEKREVAESTVLPSVFNETSEPSQPPTSLPTYPFAESVGPKPHNKYDTNYWRWNTDRPTTASAAAQEEEALLSGWDPPCVQPLIHLFGMSVFPLQYEPGLAERSTRRVRAVIAPGEKVREKDNRKDQDKESTKKLEEWMERKWRGVQEEMLDKLTRVVLEPWNSFDDGGCADDHRIPKVQIPERMRKTDEEREGGLGRGDHESTSRVNASTVDGHDPNKDTIVVLMEPRIGEQVSVGMGLSGTWVQIVRKRHEGGDQSIRGGHRGRGRGRGRGGPPVSETLVQEEDSTPAQNTDDNTVLSSPAPDDPPVSHGPVDRGGRVRGRGRGGPGRGRHTNGGAHIQREFVFWYVEELFMAIPSFWTVGEEEEPLRLPDDAGEQDDDEFSDDFED
ncbi:hypothetical protein CPB83DRAFT_901623 [Crepidotus variabilis]|uniref:Uncharacterized protein n=1 Tax=Crepidotus variabilis TaxID=179855 RepID=A0A9P6ET33_9AGAR|nr:hypothetical protein CPB83DRAFT_901623 [Crepidotus variabilis]